MTKVKLTANLGGHTAATTINVTPDTAERLIQRGLAEAIASNAKARGKAVDEGVGGTPNPASFDRRG